MNSKFEFDPTHIFSFYYMVENTADGELIRSGYLSNENKVTGARASKRVIEIVAKDEQNGFCKYSFFDKNIEKQLKECYNFYRMIYPLKSYACSTEW